jgi:hypothetical protein
MAFFSSAKTCSSRYHREGSVKDEVGSSNNGRSWLVIVGLGIPASPYLQCKGIDTLHFFALSSKCAAKRVEAHQATPCVDGQQYIVRGAVLITQYWLIEN